MLEYIRLAMTSAVGKTREAVSGLTALPVAGTPDKAGIRGLHARRSQVADNCRDDVAAVLSVLREGVKKISGDVT
jgi:hypothetical protein